MRRARVIGILIIHLALAGCASNRGAENGEEAGDSDPGKMDPYGNPMATGRAEIATAVTYESTAEANFFKGEREMEAEDYLRAQQYFAYVRTKFPYSQYAALSEIRIADAQFLRERYTECIDNYQNFIRMHPTHERVPYALFKIGMSFREQIPGDWFLLPPSEEKDQAAVRDAERALRDYVERFPDHENAAAAREVLAEVRRRLMAHERYAADFYQNLDKDRAYVGRLEVIRKQYTDVGLTDELLGEIIKVWARLGEIERAKNAMAELQEKFPSSREVVRGEKAIGAAPSAKVAPEVPKEPPAKEDSSGAVDGQNAVDPADAERESPLP